MTFNIDEMDGYDFEDLVSRIMKKKGYKNVKVTKKSGDEGKDIIMERSEGGIVVVECKKYKGSVGRPIIQKLQGAMEHERKRNPGKNLSGIVVASGSFSNQAIEYSKEFRDSIELIDGKKLRDLCKDLNIIVLNSGVQILTNDCFEYMNNNEAVSSTIENYSKIYGNENHKPKVETDLSFKSVYFAEVEVEFNTYTSIGCVDEYCESSEFAIDGVTKKYLDPIIKDFFFSKDETIGEIESKYDKKKILYEFSENEIEKLITDISIETHTHTANYIGRNNQSYSKQCVPKKDDINITASLSIYMPYRSNEMKILDMKYNQEFYNKGSDTLYICNELLECKICENEYNEYIELSLCIKCARIVCKRHIKIDYWDKTTPICTIHTKKFKLWLETKYFSLDKNKKEYEAWYNERNFFGKLYEDKIVFYISIGGGIVIFIIILMWIGNIS